MIRVDRARIPEPAALSRVRNGKTERQRVLAEYREWLENQPGGEPPPGTIFSYKGYAAYKLDEVKTALEQLFHGKCAYCEARYAGTQPVDVEHWRPKAEVHVDGGDAARQIVQGYFWLASTWENLLPSCIDCNRGRKQRDFVTGAAIAAGKANQFPVVGTDRLGPPAPGSDASTGTEQPLLLDPCVDDPEEHLEFTEDAAVLPRDGGDRDRALASIRVYALNRAELVQERRGIRRLLDQRLQTIETLVALRDELRDRAGLARARDAVEDLISHEINAVLAMAEATQPFSAMVRQVLREVSPLVAVP